MLIKIDLVINKGFKWFTKENIFVKGYLYDSGGNYYEKEKLIDFFIDVNSHDTLKNKLVGISGLFTVVIKLNKTEVLLANDIIRAFPVFYSFEKNFYYISDDPDIILKPDHKLSDTAKKNFLSIGFVTGHNTLFKDLYITQAGEITHFKNDVIQSESYFDYAIYKASNKSTEKLVLESQKLIDHVFKNLVDSLKGRKAVIPLSGGFDSRLIACKLREFGYQNVLCYSYGKSENNFEKNISKKVANELSYEWKFIEYNPKMIGDYLRDEVFLNYVDYYSQYSSTFMFHDYFAVKHLKENDLIPDNAVFIPGHSGDFLGGSQLYKNGNLKYIAKLNRIAEKIFKNRFILTKLSNQNEKVIINSILQHLKSKYNIASLPYAYSIFEDWEIKENLSKLIAKSTHIYDYFGFEYRLPFWNRELVQFYKSVPYSLKFGKILFNEVLQNYFKKFGVNYNDGKIIAPGQFKFYRIRKEIKRLTPSFISAYIKPQPDILNYNLAQNQLVQDLKKSNYYFPRRIKHRNSIFAHWYLNKIEKQFRK